MIGRPKPPLGEDLGRGRPIVTVNAPGLGSVDSRDCREIRQKTWVLLRRISLKRVIEYRFSDDRGNVRWAWALPRVDVFPTASKTNDERDISGDGSSGR